MEDKIEKELAVGIRYSVLNKKLEELRALERVLPSIDDNVISMPMWVGNWKAGLAAAAILFVGILSILLIRQKDSPEELFARNFEPYPNVFEPTQRGVDGTSDRRATAFAMYEQGNYAEAATLFNQLIAEKKEAEILLLLGNSNMVLNRDEEAKNNFLTLIRDFDGLDEQAKWFLSLVYLKSGESEKAKLIWEELGDPKITYSEKAKKLLKEVK